MDLGICFWVAGVVVSSANETPGFRSYLTPTPATLTKLTIIRERTHLQISIPPIAPLPFTTRQPLWKVAEFLDLLRSLQ